MVDLSSNATNNQQERLLWIWKPGSWNLFFFSHIYKIKLGAFEMDTFVCVDHLGESPSLSRGWGVTKPAWLEIEKGLTAVYWNECLTQSKSHAQTFQALLLRGDLLRCQTIMIKLYSQLHYFHDYCVLLFVASPSPSPSSRSLPSALCKIITI